VNNTQTHPTAKEAVVPEVPVVTVVQVAKVVQGVRVELVAVPVNNNNKVKPKGKPKDR
jgi:enamine deaminase RidA (YjgF/YER057c/UK114 family)